MAVRVQIQLACGHMLEFTGTTKPRPEETELWCVRCQAMRLRTSDQMPQWRIACEDCKYSRNFGQAQLSATVYATKHMIKRNHNVNEYYGKTLRQKHIANKRQLEFTDEPPF